MKRFVMVCAGSTALALGIAVAPAAAAAGAVAHTWTKGEHGVIAAKVVNLRKMNHAATGRHAALEAPIRYFNPSAVAAQRAAAVRTGGRHAGVVKVAAPGTRQSVTPTTTLQDFPAMNLNQQVSELGADQQVEPPDTQLATGPSSVLETVNSSMSVWSKTGAFQAAIDLNVFFGVPSGFSFSDPRVLYDAESGRWFVSGFSFDSSNDSQTYLAVSASSDPTQDWNVYVVADETGVLTDQPMTGVCNDKVVEGWDDFSSSSAVAPLRMPR